MLYGRGISKMGELLDLAVKLDIIQKSGAWFSLQWGPSGPGPRQFPGFLGANPALAEEIEVKVRANVDKLYDKIPSRTPDRAVATPVELPAAPVEAAKPAEAPKAASAKLDIDITVDD